METSIKVLPELKVVCFEAYSPDSEIKAFNKMKDWIKKSGLTRKTYRVFGYNIDSHGNLTYDSQHAGYKVLLNIDYSEIDSENIKTDIIKPGKFLVTRTEGYIADAGKWLPEGWNWTNRTIQTEKLKVRNSPRWFEEHILTQEPDYILIDLYLEIE